MKPKLYHALGLMSGTSIDGIDVALIETDGADFVRPLGAMGVPYPLDFREKIRAQFGNSQGTADPKVAVLERNLTEKHAEVVRAFLSKTGEKIDLIGFHGQTLHHDLSRRMTVQIGDGALLARLTGIDVVNDFRTADVLAGGNGAPLVPLYHRALVSALEKPVVILNVGGVSNMTWIGGSGDADILAFDIGPGNAFIDDWVFKRTGAPFDRDGALAASGKVDWTAVDGFIQNPFFARRPPKSLDRNEFKNPLPEGFDTADGAATLTMMTAKSVEASLSHLSKRPKVIYVAGGGRHNKTLMKWIGEALNLDVRSVDVLGWNGDALEAEAFAWLAVRSVSGRPLTLPGTTGVLRPMCGGTLHKAQI